MFKTAVVGPIVSTGIGVARQCVECGGAGGGGDGKLCSGFGPGCLGLRRRGPGVPIAADEGDVRLSFRNVAGGNR
jgi:hypothetical protein